MESLQDGFKTILVPVDFTARNRGAIRAAQKIATTGHGAVTLIHVIERIDHLPWESLRTFYRKLEKRARHKLGSLAASAEKSQPGVIVKLAWGHRVQTIVDYASRHRFDLIVLSSHCIDPQIPGRGWATVSYRVALLARSPVLLVK